MNNNDHLIDAFTDMSPNYEETMNSELSRFWGWSYQGFINTLIQLTPIPDDATTLDIATGTGVIPIKLLNRNGNNHPVHGLDITHSMLIQAKSNLKENNFQESVKLTCASAMQMPYAPESFDLVFCGLATHHMDVEQLLAESHRILRLGGRLSFADAGSTRLWNFPGLKWIVRLLVFVYYMYKEDLNRARAEAGAVSNVRSAEEWFTFLHELSFKNITIRKLKSKNFWIPSPLVILAEKLEEEENDQS